MNDSTATSKFIYKFTFVLFILSLIIGLAGYVYYQKNIKQDPDTVISTDFVDALSDEELLEQTLNSIPVPDPEDALATTDIKNILKNNDAELDPIDPESVLTPEQRETILRNNLEASVE